VLNVEHLLTIVTRIGMCLHVVWNEKNLKSQSYQEFKVIIVCRFLQVLMCCSRESHCSIPRRIVASSGPAKISRTCEYEEAQAHCAQPHKITSGSRVTRKVHQHHIVAPCLDMNCEMSM